MKKVYTSENRFYVGNIRNLLEAQGIEVVLRNEHVSSAVGEIPVFDTWPELWVVKERDFPRAEQIVQQALSPAGAAPWRCKRCGEENDQAFEFCWQCQSDPGGILLT
ncbi:DUF2007 domain-containing protein [Halioglobus maricola]|uniref:DUF2007 domain-containing protein n=1 Tax=Halioglobus maricola TaxID=2601894 RepID=A0A5P9NNH6_9GAMM|nr:DUF2007 domain-containing protein [Halioglobus maricola]QFU77046.1 DUF2007 domain-containing protein [Halioglobus maricola]